VGFICYRNREKKRLKA